MEAFKRKVLIIGIDGASWNLYDKVINSGYMPYLKKLRDEGAYGSLFSTIPPISPSAWGTIQTGIDAINNHIYEFYCIDKVKKKVKIVNSLFLKNTIWVMLSQVGKKVAVINVPMTYPPKKVNGYIISGILTPSLESNFTYPNDLKNYILRKIPDYQLRYSEDIRYGNPHNDIKGFVKKRIKNIKDRTKVCVWILNNFKVDIMMVNFQANDILQHVLWGYMEKNNDLYDKNIKLYIFQNFHKALDLCIETLREEFIRNSTGELLTIILSDHGCESHNKQFFLGDWLFHQNLLKLRTNIFKSIIRKKLKNLFLKSIISKVFLNYLKKLELKIKIQNKFEQQTKFLQKNIDWKNSYAFSTGIGLYGLIFILKKEKEREKLINFLKNRLYRIKDPDKGINIVDKIYDCREIYKGNKPDLIPDLIIKPIKGYSFTGLFQNEKNLFQKVDKLKDFAIGKHSEEGILIMHGPSIIRKKVESANLKDIVPTILYYFQLPLRDDLDGNILKYFKI